MRSRKSEPAPAVRRRHLSYQGPEALFDTEERRMVGMAELLDHVRRGGRFEATDSETGKDVTQLVLARVLTEAIPRGAAPGLSLLPGLGP